MTNLGKVYLVGGGPGDPGLITVKGMEALRSSDVVVYDRLIDTRLLDHAPRAEHIYVGKLPHRHILSQDEINALLVERGRAGQAVVRLKGGDPFIFGRGGEEAEALQQAGVRFEVVPGVSSAIAAAAYAGIPITHRGYTSSFAVVTGHEDPTKETSSVHLEGLATSVGTLVFLMGVENIASLVAELMRHGRRPETPIALVRWGTWTRQETVTGTLGDIVERLEGRRFSPPAVIIVGEVVALRERLRWFDNRPLWGKRVLITRSRDQAARLAQLLADQGAEPIEVPTIVIAPPEDTAPLDEAIGRLQDYAWAVFASVNGVSGFFSRLGALGRDARALAEVQVCAIGPATAASLRERGITPDFVPEAFATQEIARALIGRGVDGCRILFPRTDIPGEDLTTALQAAGAQVDEVVAYRTIPVEDLDPAVREQLRAGEIDFVSFTSSSTVRNMVALLGDDRAALDGCTIASIGPVTSKAAKELGLRVDVEAKEHTVPGLVSAILERVYLENETMAGHLAP